MFGWFKRKPKLPPMESLSSEELMDYVTSIGYQILVFKALML